MFSGFVFVMIILETFSSKVDFPIKKRLRRCQISELATTRQQGGAWLHYNCPAQFSYTSRKS